MSKDSRESKRPAVLLFLRYARQAAAVLAWAQIRRPESAAGTG